MPAVERPTEVKSIVTASPVLEEEDELTLLEELELAPVEEMAPVLEELAAEEALESVEVALCPVQAQRQAIASPKTK